MGQEGTREDRRDVRNARGRIRHGGSEWKWNRRAWHVPPVMRTEVPGGKKGPAAAWRARGERPRPGEVAACVGDGGRPTNKRLSPWITLIEQDFTNSFI